MTSLGILLPAGSLSAGGSRYWVGSLSRASEVLLGRTLSLCAFTEDRVISSSFLEPSDCLGQDSPDRVGCVIHAQ